VLSLSSGSSREASRAFRFRRVKAGAVGAAARRRRRDACEGVSVASSSVGSTDVPRSDLIWWPDCDSLSPATVSVWERIDRLLLRSRTEPPALDEFRLPGLVHLMGPFRLERPVRGSGSSSESSTASLRCFISRSEGTCGVDTGSPFFGSSLSLSLPLPRDFRGDLALGGLCAD